MNRGIRLLLLVLAVCLSLAAVVPDAGAACLFPCSTNGQTTLMQDSCCPGLAFGPTIRNRKYVCQNGCFQRTNITMCTLDPCV